jgi:hypothetical protein
MLSLIKKYSVSHRSSFSRVISSKIKFTVSQKDKKDCSATLEPTNHINFRHLPVIAASLNTYKGALVMVSHDEGFVREMENVREIDLKRLIK